MKREKRQSGKDEENEIKRLFVKNMHQDVIISHERLVYCFEVSEKILNSL